MGIALLLIGLIVCLTGLSFYGNGCVYGTVAESRANLAVKGGFWLIVAGIVWIGQVHSLRVMQGSGEPITVIQGANGLDGVRGDLTKRIKP